MFSYNGPHGGVTLYRMPRYNVAYVLHPATAAYLKFCEGEGRAPNARGSRRRRRRIGGMWGGGVPLPFWRGLSRVMSDFLNFGFKMGHFCSKFFCVFRQEGDIAECP